MPRSAPSPLATTVLALVALACASEDPSGLAPQPAGGVKVTATMAGVDLPVAYGARVDGQTVFVDRGAPAVLRQVTAGAQQVQLLLPTNCKADGDNPAPVTVVAGRTVTVPFAVTCVSTTGFLRVTAPTSGTDLDVDGYTVAVSGRNQTGTQYERTEVVVAGGPPTLFAVPVGRTVLTFRGVALNCYGAESGTQTVEVRSADTANVVYSISCERKAQLAYVLYGLNRDIYLMYEDGSDVRRLTFDEARDEDPAWSPDGSKIAFTSDRGGNREIYVMNADGSDPVRLTNDSAADYQPSWSPDGGKIAFASTRGAGLAKIFVMNADGTDPVSLTSGMGEDYDPTWSPDGEQIAFTSTRGGTAAVYIMSADGSHATLVTPAGGQQPAWSPDGAAVAYSANICPGRFYYTCFPSIFVQRGATSVQLLDRDAGERPSWSPDGRKIAFTGRSCDYYYTKCDVGRFGIARVDGSDDVVLRAFGYAPTWRPR